MIDDSTAVKLIRQKNPAGFKHICESYGPKLLHFFQIQCSKMGRPPEDAEDVLHNTLIKFVEKIDRYDDKRGSVATFLSAIGVNLCKDLLRKKTETPFPKLSKAFEEEEEEEKGNGEAERPWEQLADTRDLERELCHQLCVDKALQLVESKVKNAKLCIDALMFQAHGEYIEVIAARIGRTKGATAEFLSQCRKKLKSYLLHCWEECDK